jgi:DNA-binding NtrC family response regulator
MNCEMIGTSPAIERLRDQAAMAARSTADILVEGESGSGKEVLARLIHRLSERANGPFIAVNCAALPEVLDESELFGQARGGTLLLDEIHEMPLALQPKLLRVLQGEARVIATTNQSLGEMVAEGKFRADLFYRLNVIPLRVPPLRERREDIPALVEHFLRLYAGPRLDAEAPPLPLNLFAPLEQHAWPGNVRELENLVRRTLALGPSPTECVHHTPVSSPSQRASLIPGRSLRDVERQMLEVTLQATSGNRTHAAAMLGVSLRTIRNKIREFGLPARGVA